jgi:hypothetical protein
LFAAFFNWVVNGRSILPMAPAVGILIARRLEAGAWGGKTVRLEQVWACLIVGAMLAVQVAREDFRLAHVVRQSVRDTFAKYGHGTGALWFEGHWGWQFYMQELGARAVEVKHTICRPGDFLAIPINNCNPTLPRKDQAHPKQGLAYAGPRFLTTMSQDIGAGFYAAIWGPLPFAFGSVPPETVLVYSFGEDSLAAPLK